MRAASRRPWCTFTVSVGDVVVVFAWTEGWNSHHCFYGNCHSLTCPGATLTSWTVDGQPLVFLR